MLTKSRFPSIGRWLALVLLVAAAAFAQIRYKEVVGPAGNTYVDPQYGDPDHALSLDDLPQPAAERVRLLVPNPQSLFIQKSAMGVGLYWSVKATRADESKWDLDVWPDGRVTYLRSVFGAVREDAGRIFEAGKIREIELKELPRAVAGSARSYAGDKKLTKAYSVDGVAGHRFFLQYGDETNGAIFSVTDSGEIRAADDVTSMLQPIKIDQPESMEEIDARLAKYGDKYRVDKVLAKIRNVPFERQKGFRFVAMGDDQGDFAVWQMIVQSINKWQPLFAIDVGDLTPRGMSYMVDEYLLAPLEKYARYPFLPVVGNHDRGTKGLQYEYVFGGDSSRVYHFDYGNCRFVVLDNGVAEGIMPWPEQLDLADKWLAEKPDYRKFVFLHKPPVEVQKWAYHAMPPAWSAPFVALMSKHKVDHVFCGHIHAYSTENYDGVNYTVTGGAGAGLHRQYGELGSVYHYVVVDVLPQEIKMQVVRFYPQE